MLRGDPVRDILHADIAIASGLATAYDVTQALKLAVSHGNAETSFLDALVQVAGIGSAAAHRIAEEVQILVAQANGDERQALARRTDPGCMSQHANTAQSVPPDRPLTRLRVLPQARYTDFSIAGTGGMGIVFAALDTEMNRRVALKMVRPPSAHTSGLDHPTSPLEASRPVRSDPDADAFEVLQSRIVREAWITGGLEHPGIVPVYEIGLTPSGITYYAMRYVRGERTFADAIREKAASCITDRLALLEPFLKVCDTVSYAHHKGVVHRDIKPLNVALGSYGEVVLLDWGLARLTGKPTETTGEWHACLKSLRDASAPLTLDGGAIGTLGYMSPEAAVGHHDDVDERSDVYSLGAMLFEILTGRTPFQARSLLEYASALLAAPAPTAKSLDPAVPEPLSDLCARALSARREDRTPSAESLAKALREWQGRDAMDRELEATLRDANLGLESAAALPADLQGPHLDRVSAALANVEARRPGCPEARAIGLRAASLREQAMRARDLAGRRRLLSRIATAAILVVSISSALVIWALENRRVEADAARAEAQAALADKSKALEEVLQLSDAKESGELVKAVDLLWPVAPQSVDKMAAWLARAAALVSRRDLHERRLRTVQVQALPYTDEDWQRDHGEEQRRKDMLFLPLLAKLQSDQQAESDPELLTEYKAEIAKVQSLLKRMDEQFSERWTWRFNDPGLDWQNMVLRDILRALDDLEAKDGLIGVVRQRHDLAKNLRAVSLETHAAAWEATTAGIAQSEHYQGFSMKPVVGLVPLGPDPHTGLYEFAHVGSGSIPTRSHATGELLCAEDSAIVLVLVPSGTYVRGAQRVDAAGLNYDPGAMPHEGPPGPVTIPTFMMAKHEVTQSQWACMAQGATPSTAKPGKRYGDRVATIRQPVESVSWEDCDLWMRRHRLALPTEAQWEYACRAGSIHPWSVGSSDKHLGKYANICDAHAFHQQGDKQQDLRFAMYIDDGHFMHAPVGSLLPNAWGLHDMHGNVAEWCRDVYGPRAYAQSADSGSVPPVNPLVLSGGSHRVIRGGSFMCHPGDARCSHRNAMAQGFRVDTVGVRPIYPIDS